jgi:hypothetical protein
MFDFFRRSTRGLALSSLLVTSLLLAVACDPNTGLADSSDVTAPTTPEGSDEAVAPATPEESSEVPEPTPPEPSAPPDMTAQAVTGLRTVAGWESLFLGTWNNEHTSIYLPKSNSYDSYQYYNLAYAIDATTAMYPATGKTQ